MTYKPLAYATFMYSQFTLLVANSQTMQPFNIICHKNAKHAFVLSMLVVAQCVN